MTTNTLNVELVVFCSGLGHLCCVSTNRLAKRVLLYKINHRLPLQ